MYKLGALKNTKDERDLMLVSVQAPVLIPEKYETDISWIPVLDQKLLGSCVGHAHALIHIYNEYKESKEIIKSSPRFLYALSKKFDNNKAEGTYPRVTAKIMKDYGCATEDYITCDDSLSHEDYIKISETENNANKYKIKSFAFVNNDLESLKQAIYKNGLVAITISIGNFDNPIKYGNIGLHRVIAYGYDKDVIKFRNSWGENWGEKGNGWFKWSEQKLQDLMVFIDLPKEVIEQNKGMYKYFSKKEVETFKLDKKLWELLDKMRELAGVPFILTSGLRTEEVNKKVGGKSNSAHLRGLAVDLKCSDNFNRAKMLSAILKFKDEIFVEITDKHIHIDIDNKIHQLGQVMLELSNE